MSEITEHRVGRILLTIDRHLCVGFGDCVEEAPDAFELDDEGIAVLKPEAVATTEERLVAACRSCPVDALTAHDETGTQLAP